MQRLKDTIAHLYTGRSRRAAGFRYGLLAFDLFTIAFLIVTGPLPTTPAIVVADIVIGLLILADFLSRLWIAPKKLWMLRQIHSIADILVIMSLLLAPLLTENLAFLRVLRMLRLLYSYHVLRDLRRHTPFFRRNEEVIVSSVNLGVFVLVVTTLVFALQFGRNPRIHNYIDALYFTVGTLTTTGFGDITLTGSAGRLLSVFIMVVGVALFLRLAQAIFWPHKVAYTCPDCGLTRHDPDAVHCKHCGRLIKIETEGMR
jgi:voltage-gated potassium channel